MNKKENPHEAGPKKPRKYSRATASIRPGTKEGRLLSALLAGATVNRYEAARHYFDWCLNTTISILRNEHQIPIVGEWEVVPAVRGTKTVRVKRYSLPNSARGAVIKALGQGGSNA